MRSHWLKLLSTTFLALTIGVGCAPAEEDAASDDNAAAASQELNQLNDAQLMGKLRGILSDVSFTSESDYPYVVFEGDAVAQGSKRLSTKIVREKLKAGVKSHSSSERDISLAACRADRLNVSQAISDGNDAEVPTDRDADDWVYAHHDKQLSIALKVMRKQLRGVVGYTFGTNASGDQDEFGTVHYVWVGISKTTGKLIAIMTEAVYT